MTPRAAQALSAERPFPGLRPFDFDDYEFFFGREDQIAALYRLVDRNKFVAVVGSSGCGKSSLTRAGLLHVLDNENAEGRPAQWTWRIMRPGDTPIEALTEALIDLSADDDETITRMRREGIGFQLNRSSFGLAEALEETELPDGHKFLLVVDQFEELFRYSDQRIGQIHDRLHEARARDEAESFVALLLEARRSSKRDIRILITMRSDFIGDCARFPGLPEAVSATQFLVPGMIRDQYEAIIRKPIAKAGATIDPELVEQLLNDADDERDRLPVLQHCLLQLWEQAGAENGGKTADPAANNAGGPAVVVATRRHIDLEDYDQIGRIANALSQHADRILQNYREEAVEAVFRALSELKDDRAIRRALPYWQLRDECGIPKLELESIVNGFRADECSFLVTSPLGVLELEDSTVIDVGHEALLRRWARIRGVPGATGDSEDKRPIGWLRQERKDGQRYQILLSMLDDRDASKKVEDIESHRNWWKERIRTPQWAERYGGKYKMVEKLLRDGWAHRQTVRARDWALAIAGALILMSAIYYGYSKALETRIQSQVADANFNRSIDITKKFLDQVSSALNSGTMKVDAALAIEKSLHSVVKELKGVGDSSRTTEMEIQIDAVAIDFFTDAGLRTDALQRAKEAKDLAQRFSDLDVNDDKRKSLLVGTTLRLGDALEDAGHSEDSLTQYQAALSLEQTLADKQPADGGRQYTLAFSHNKVGEALSYKNDYAGALKQFSEALSVATRLAAKSPENAEWQAYVPNTMTKIADALANSGPDVAPALAQFDAATAIQTALAEKFPGDAVILSNLAGSHRGKAGALVLAKKWDEASSEFEAAIAARQRLLKIDPKNASWLDYLATDHAKFANALIEHSKEAVFDAASADTRTASEIAADTAASATKKTTLRTAALAEVREELRARQSLSALDPNHLRWKQSLAATQEKLSNLETEIKKSDNGG